MRSFLIFLIAVSASLPMLISRSNASKKSSGEKSDIVSQKINTDTTTSPAFIFNKISQTQLTEGVLTLKENSTGTIRIYNFQNQEWLKVRLDSTAPDSLKSYSAYLDYQNLVFRVTRIEHDHYEVIVNEETGLTARIKKDEPSLRFQRWEQHIPTVFSVDFDAEKNPVKQDTIKQARATYSNSVEFFYPVKINGDWLQVKWDDNVREKTGWVKWRKGNVLLVYLNYIA
ncbi:MAG: hypothetical protein J7527_01160 [Chitinophagaceae bacterium]|nr:hypothetical protein [Chitinophagaceae bacterium]